MEWKTLYIISASFQLFFVASFVMSLTASFKKGLPLYLRRFYIYPAVALVMILFMWLDFFAITPRGFFSNLNFFSLSFHFIFLTWFILQVTKESGAKKVENVTRNISIVLVLLCIANDYLHKLNRSYILVNSLLFFYCLFYFARLFKSEPHFRLTARPEFWMITGIFLGMGIILPFYIFHEFLITRVTGSTINLLRLIGVCGYAIMHLFFVKGLFCDLNQLRRNSAMGR